MAFEHIELRFSLEQRSTAVRPRLGFLRRYHYCGCRRLNGLVDIIIVINALKQLAVKM